MASDEKNKDDLGFKNFDVVSDYSDHHYINSKTLPFMKKIKKAKESSKDKEKVSSENKPLYKKIMKEWKILEENLPESIYVRVYEERLDLLRAAIVGASGTPYHDGLFFFDIYLPSDYPEKPPKVYYHSHGLRLNPNLYANGYVCLSLVNTWPGNKEERWTPTMSTILQLLLSIQGLVLNAEPFFNEPGELKSSTSHIASAIYDADAFLLSCRTMIHTIDKPPKNFEGIVKEHFRERGDYVLESFKAYRHGLAAVGYYQYKGPCSSSPSSVDLKDKLKTSETKMLFEALEKKFLSLTEASEEEDDDELEEKADDNITDKDMEEN